MTEWRESKRQQTQIIGYIQREFWKKIFNKAHFSLKNVSLKC